jgi:hypothetical protein
MRRITGLAAAVVLALPDLAVAQGVVEETRTTTNPDGSTTQVRRISQVIGSTVQLEDANEFGKVEDIVLNDNGCIECVGVAHNNQFAWLPWGAANLNYGRRVVSFNVAPTAIQRLFFSRNSWPTLSDTKYVGRVREVFGRGGALRREVLRPAPGASGVVLGPGTPPPCGTEKIKVNERTGRVKIKERN